MPGRIPPSTWGPFFWHTMHILALGYPNTPTYAEKRAAKEFFESLQHLIPCPVCRHHYTDYLKENPLTPSLDTRKDLFTWTINLHNTVNKQLGKPEFTEMESINFYHTLGELNRSPIWTPDDLQAIQFREALKIIGIIVSGGAILGGLYFGFSMYFKPSNK
uniref:thiol oxidase n=1 Tax=viral metagenome TaxID=1070528 RepID=A0A6C0HEJ8_9ZZZZ